jgi:pre-rRNA-processing protein IPI3
VAATPFHLLSGSDDSQVHVWTLPRLLDLNAAAESDPDRTLSNHRATIVSLAVGPSSHPATNLCVSASKDKTCIVWNYLTGVALCTLLFPSSPLCVSLDPGTRAVYLSTDDGCLFAVELFGERPLLGPHSVEHINGVIEVKEPFGVAPDDAGPASCLALTYDGTLLLSGHTQGQILQWNLGGGFPVELANVNAAVTNLVVVPPRLPVVAITRAQTVVTPNQADRKYAITTQFEGYLGPGPEFLSNFTSPGFPDTALESAVLAFEQPAMAGIGSQELQHQNAELLEILNEQMALHREALRQFASAKSL